MRHKFSLFVKLIWSAVLLSLLIVACSPAIVLKPTPTEYVPATATPTKVFSNPKSTATAVPTPRKTEKSYCVVETGLENGNIHVRSGPGKQFESMFVLNEGEEVLILDDVDGWFLVEIVGNFGYVSSNLCKVERK